MTSIVELGHSIFACCTDLRSITLPQNLQVIPDWFFQGCTSLIDIRIPVSVVQIGHGAFYDSGIKSIKIPDNVLRIGKDAFSGSDLQSITIHSSNLNMANNGIFGNCPSLSVINMYPWLWPKLFALMDGHHDFIFKFSRQYQTHILDFEIIDGKRRGKRSRYTK